MAVAATVASSVAAPLSDVAPTVAAADVLRRPAIPASSAPIASSAYAAGIPAAAPVAGVCTRAATATGVTRIDACGTTPPAAATTTDVRSAVPAAPRDLRATPSGRPLAAALCRNQRTGDEATGSDQHQDWRHSHGLPSYACVYDDCRGRIVTFASARKRN